LNYQLSSTNKDIGENNDESSLSLIKKNSAEINVETEDDSDDDKTVCDDEQDLIRQDPLYELLNQDYMNVQLDNRLKSAVRKFLRARFCKYSRFFFF